MAHSSLSHSHPGQLRSLAPSVRASSRLPLSRQTASRSSRVVAAASSAPALGAHTSHWLSHQPSGHHPSGPVGTLGFPTQLHQDFQTEGRFLGQGAYGTVHCVIDRRTGVEYACKTLPKVRGRLTAAKTAKKIWAEVDIHARVSQSSAVAALHSVYEDDANVYIIQEMCHGGDLDKLLREHGPLNERQTALILYECVRVVHACHEAGFVHSDLKPANFLLKQRMHNPLPLIEAGNVRDFLKAIDFGCSQEDNGIVLTRRTGTPVYMAPEVFDRGYNKKADMWSLGIIMYQMLNNRYPFWSNHESAQHKSIDTVARTVRTMPIDFHSGPFHHMCPEGIDLIKGLLERDPAKRLDVYQALAHPWFVKMYRQPPSVTRVNNVVPAPNALKGHRHPQYQQQHPQYQHHHHHQQQAQAQQHHHHHQAQQHRQQHQQQAAVAEKNKSVMASVGRSYPSPTAYAC